MKRSLRTTLSTVVVFLAAALFLSVPVHAEDTEDIVDVTDYSYTVTPILAPFQKAIYVKTDNPDPESFRLVDRDNSYATDGKTGSVITSRFDNGYYSMSCDAGTFYLDSTRLFADVKYENTSTLRVNGGYIFVWDGAGSDGGMLTLQQATSKKSMASKYFVDTSVKVSCPKLQNYTDYLIDTYTSKSKSLFENLDAVESALYELAVYPHGIYDSDKPTERPYPLLATSPYEELGLNTHYECMFERHSGGALLSYAYPFVLTSLGWPGTMRSIASKLEPSCTVEAGGVHWLIRVTYGGETHSYGWAGAGGYDPVFTSRIAKDFTFKGGSADYSTGKTLKDFRDRYLQYSSWATEDVKPYRDMVAGDTFSETISATGGTWIRVVAEGWFGFSGTNFAYVIPSPGGGVRILSDAWVDGRYINAWESLDLNAKFADHPDADIVVPQMSYTDKNGAKHKQDVLFQKDTESGNWTAPTYYANTNYYYSNLDLPDEFILTPAEVAAMNIDGGTHIPSTGLIYDGTEAPGTKFTLSLVTGIRINDSNFDITVDDSKEISTTISPSNAYDKKIYWKSSDENIADVTDYGTIYTKNPGTVTITATARDGGFSASITVTVKKHDWRKDSNGWWYRNLDGTYPRNEWKVISRKHYHFNSKGYMDTGWINLDNVWYYLGTNGAAVTGWQQINGQWYYFGSNEYGSNYGAMNSDNRKYIGGKLYAFSDNGSLIGANGGWSRGTNFGTEYWFYTKKGGEFYTGWQKIGNKWYYLDDYWGYMYSDGIYTINKKEYAFASGGSLLGDNGGWVKTTVYSGYEVWCYADKGGALRTGWQKIAGKWYYFYTPEDYYGLECTMCSGEIFEIGGKKYIFAENGMLQGAAGGWVKYVSNPWGTYTRTDWYYTEAGGALKTGWQKIGGTWYYFDEDNGDMYYGGIYNIGGKQYLFGQNGALQGAAGGWVKYVYNSGKTDSSEVWYYTEAGGALITGWRKIAGKWYYFYTSEDYYSWECIMCSGTLFEIGGKKYIFAKNGMLQGTSGGWFMYNDAWYYSDKSGALKTGWQKIGGSWYYFDEDNGDMYYDDIYTIGDKKYLFGENGALKGASGGWVKIVYFPGETYSFAEWYYTETNGALKTGWQKIGGKWYYFDEDYGEMYYDDTYTLGDGKEYTFDENGVWVK